MKIVLDARMTGRGYGIGEYSYELFRRLPKLGAEHHWVFLATPENEDLVRREVADTSDNTEVVVVEARHYSWREQIELPRVLNKIKPDLVHFPNFNVPIFYSGKYVTTIHDVVHHLLPGHRQSRFIKRLGYRIAMQTAVKRSRAVITVSKASKQEILNTFPKAPESKIFALPEGVDPTFNPTELPGEVYTLREKYGVEGEYLLFVGVWEIKKNIPLLAEAFSLIADKYPDLKLVLAGKEDPWHPEVKQQVIAAAGKYLSRVIMPGFIATEDVPALYRHAKAFVHASMFEGFGLPGLEAMACGIPTVVADTAVFRENYGEAAQYFDGSSASSAAAAFDKVLSDTNLYNQMKSAGQVQAQGYTWEETAAKTLNLYVQI